MQIFKYPVVDMDYAELSMPEDAEILTVQVQYNVPCIWAKVNPDSPAKTRKFRTFGTGHSIPENETLNYIGTFQLLDGWFVGHLFEVI